jgi:Ice-binding-like
MRLVIGLFHETNNHQKRNNIMLKLNRTSIESRNIMKKTKHLVRGLLLGGILLCVPHAAPASPVINSFSYNFRTAMTNNGVDPDARGTVSGSLSRRGATDSQRLAITASKLETDTTYHLAAFLDDSVTATAVADFITDRRGGSSITYVKSTHPGRHPLLAAVDPISNLRELDVINNGDTVLQANLIPPDSFSYSVKREMENSGFMAGAGGVLQLRGSPRVTRVSVAATGLTPLTSYQLLVNGDSVTTKTSDRRGKLTVAGPKTGLPLVLDISTVALADGTGANVILTTTGLGIPGVLATSKGPAILGATADYAVLAGSTVTSINATTVNGDLGVWAGTDVTGFAGIVPGGPGTVNGTIHAGDAAAQIAQGDLTTAYNDAAGRTLAPVDVANADLGGRTLAPGLYKSSGTLAITGNLTLDALGDKNAVWIFQIASSLNTASGSQVILSGRANAANIYWQVGSSATLGTTTVFKGTIMADQSISLATGVTLDGRALARIGAVTMDANTITIPAP